ncbi:MAG: alpha/beta hydrolase [Thermodesulfovibrionales bacterium]|nr:alpha/beta hydrolase [Thermodesulfovibrionales bacterium]
MSKTIFMIHGMWGGPWNWENYKGFFEEKGYNCVVPTLRHHDAGFDDKPHPDLGTTSILDYAADLEEEIKQLGEMPIIMGHSMGGLLAQMLTARGLAKTAVFITPASPRGIMSITPSALWSFKSAFLRWGFWRKPYRQSFKEAVYSMMHLIDKDQQKECFGRFCHESGRAACEIGFWLLDPKKASEVDESHVTCPVLVVAGAEDRITPASTVRKVAGKYADVSTYMEMEGHAHWIMGEPGWQDVADEVATWLDAQLKQ